MNTKLSVVSAVILATVALIDGCGLPLPSIGGCGCATPPCGSPCGGLGGLGGGAAPIIVNCNGGGAVGHPGETKFLFNRSTFK